MQAVAVQAGAAEAARRDLVALFEAHGALAEPALLDELGAAADGAVRVQAVLAGLKEVPFHFDRALWNALEAKAREAVVPAQDPEPPTPAAAVSPDAERARKEALRRAAALVYDGRAEEAAEALAEAGVLADPDEVDGEDGAEEASPVAAAQQEPRTFKVAPRGDWRPLAADYAPRFETTQDVTGKSTCEGTTQDFVAYFQDRFRSLSKMLRARRELRNATAIERVKAERADVQLIGMVVSTLTTKNGHRRIEVEDETGTIAVMVRADERPLVAMADSLVEDEVIGVVGQSGAKGDVVFAQSLIRPDVPLPDPDAKRGADAPLMAAFLSDVHVGSHTFLNENWKRMLHWLNGGGSTKRERDAAGRVKYLVVPGDLVDGVGIYPGQETELSIPDVYDQYGAFGDWMAAVPDHVEVVIQPGNHDATRPAEPQPAFTQEVKGRFEHHQAHFLGNPATFRMHGVTTLGYHGFSLVDFATSVANLEYDKPIPVMEQMLKSRHLAPMYGGRTPVAPEHHDYLVINEVPDLFVTGHVHVPGIANYRGVQMVNCGTWQSQTLYQKMLNFTPDPCRMPLIDLQTLRGTLVDFQSPQAAGEMKAG